MLSFLAQAAPSADPLAGWVSLLSSGSGWAVLVSSLLTGWLVPGNIYRDSMKRADLQMELITKLIDRVDALERTVNNNTESQKTTTHLIDSVKNALDNISTAAPRRRQS